MNFRSIALAAILGLSVPAIADLAVPEVAIAQSAPTGTFRGEEWEISLWFENGTYHLYGEHLRASETLNLSEAQQTYNSTPYRREWVWGNNRSREYLVAWQPADPNYIRLQVFDYYGNANGREVMNSLMERVYD